MNLISGWHELFFHVNKKMYHFLKKWNYLLIRVVVKSGIVYRKYPKDSHVWKRSVGVGVENGGVKGDSGH